MSEKALRYRAQRGILDRDEQMSLLVQRVSGSRHGSLFYPQIAGVGLSFNPYVWSPYIDPEAGLLRIVFGLGTRAVDRSDDDYTRVVALNAPNRRPEIDADEVRQYSQRKVDVIDLEANQLVSYEFSDVAHRSPGLPLDQFASEDREFARRLEEQGMSGIFSRVLTFERLLTQTSFISDMRAMLRTLQDAYQYAVDIEFTANFFSPGQCKVNLVQCRPLQVSGGAVVAEPPEHLHPEDVLLRAHGAVIGRSRVTEIDRFVYVVPAAYGRLRLSDRYAVARLIGRVMHAEDGARTTMLIGPGRWGTTTPSLGVPVSFAEIDTISVLCEVVAMRDDLVPDVSLGTHFFNELVELDILYLALFPGRQEHAWNQEFFERHSKNRLLDLVPDAGSWAEVVRVIDAADVADPAERSEGGHRVRLNANTLKQQVICYVDRGTAETQSRS